MFGANPIPETETSNINGTSLNQQYDTLDVSYYVIFIFLIGGGSLIGNIVFNC